MTDEAPQAFGRFKHCFVVTYGRSGSTLLQGLLNSIPGYCIRGENGGAVTMLFLMWKAALINAVRFAEIAKSPQDPWYGMADFDEDAFLDRARRLLFSAYLQPPADARCVGFKEIRYGDESLQDLLEFMERLFPDACFVFNSRNLEAVARSSWWNTVPDAFERLTRYEAWMRSAFGAAQESGKQNYFWVRYEDIVNGSGAAELFRFLGEQYDEAAIRAVLDRRHSG